ncbi:MAG: hypothetical protein NZ951_07145 [Dehalococcoidia bacterium]|nr:hypothetical protein [Dehalococcoidia bacterium]MDW8119875.1 hypothetical protein [Chloroflexota bacterium]
MGVRLERDVERLEGTRKARSQEMDSHVVERLEGKMERLDSRVESLRPQIDRVYGRLVFVTLAVLFRP